MLFIRARLEHVAELTLPKGYTYTITVSNCLEVIPVVDSLASSHMGKLRLPAVTKHAASVPEAQLCTPLPREDMIPGEEQHWGRRAQRCRGDIHT